MTPEEFERCGCQIVEEVVRSWTSRYQFNIARLDPEVLGGACRYEVSFSLPLNAVPVPVEVLRIVFSLVSPEHGCEKSLTVNSKTEAEPKLSFIFESSDLVQYWALRYEPDKSWRPTPGQQLISLGFDSFESFIEARLSEKDEVRNTLDLRTPYEESRLVPPPAYSDSEDGEGGDSEWEEHGSQGDGGNFGASSKIYDSATDEQKELMRNALQAAGLPCEGTLSLPDILANIFDAADETSCGLLRHHEVMNLLTSTLSGLGLEPWDIHLLTASTQENAQGHIEYKAFVQAAPEIIEALRHRRDAYRKAGLPAAIVTTEAVQICHGDEITETVRTLSEIFEKCADPELEGLMTRTCFKDCLACRHDRISPQELQHLMQMMPEDEDGRMTYADLQEQLETLRVEALHNALVETDISSLRKHLILLLRRHGLNSDCNMHLWNLKRVLLQADQLSLSRLQIHVILCMLATNFKGLVNCHDFLQVCCAVIPRMFSSEQFSACAANMADEAAAAKSRAELAELEAMTKGMQAAADNDEEEKEKETTEVVEVDREQVEKSLTHAFSSLDDGRRGVLAAETIHKVLTSANAEVQSCQLSDPELRGLVAELVVDQNGEVAYKDHVQTWVPILFELRKIKIYEPYLQKEPFSNTPGLVLPDLSKLEDAFPLLPRELQQLGDGRRRGSKEHSSKEFDDSTTVKRLRKGARGSVMGTASTLGSERSSLHALKMKRSSVDSSMLGARSSMLGAGGIVKRNPTLESKKSISKEEDHPSGAGRGEKRREKRGIIAQYPGDRRGSKERGSSKDGT